MPPLGMSGGFSTSQSAASRALRMLKTQLNLALGQREEDPERAWLEVVGVRERLDAVVGEAKDDALLAADVARFRAKLREQVEKLTRELGDELIAPLYSWVDLLRQRARLDVEVETAKERVAQARASRGAPALGPLTTADEAQAALTAAETELARFEADVPRAPVQQVLAVWAESGGDALRPTLPLDPAVVRARGLAARRVLDRLRGRPPGLVPYAGSRLELIVVPAIGTCALLASAVTLASSGSRAAFGIVAVAGWVTFAAALGVSAFARQRASAERAAAIDAVWHHTLFSEQTSSLELEVGWLRALSAAMRARRAFDEHRGEGGQLDELAKRRPDLEPVVADVARSRTTPLHGA